MNLSRLIDRENNLYKEEVKDSATGDIIHRCEEPLSDNKGHVKRKVSGTILTYSGIVDDLEAALEQFRLISNDLGESTEKGT